VTYYEIYHVISTPSVIGQRQTGYTITQSYSIKRVIDKAITRAMPYLFKGDSLIGKSNYIKWKIKADLYLEINSYMLYINRSKERPNKALYFKTIKDD